MGGIRLIMKEMTNIQNFPAGFTSTFMGIVMPCLYLEDKETP
jgi:hypothetical protein